MQAEVQRPAPPQPIPLPGVKKIVAVGSGKGGVGKSTVALNLAAACALAGKRVGLLDADIYGPSLQKLLNVNEKPHLRDDKKLDPIHVQGLDVMSIAFIMGEGKAMLWRGPMVMGALRQMLFEVAWDNLDILFVDLPPGTGDAQLTLAQSVIVDGAVIVSTPQDLALLDARRGLNLFRRVSIPILGLVENMSLFTCDGCGSHFEIFGHGGAQKEAERLDVLFLGALPLDPKMRLAGDAGQIYVKAEAVSEGAKSYFAIASKVLQALDFR